MKIIKRNGAEEVFDVTKIVIALQKANAAVEALGARRGYRFINVNAPLMDCEGRLRADYTIEGMHIKEIGYRAIWPLVKAAILA